MHMRTHPQCPPVNRRTAAINSSTAGINSSTAGINSSTASINRGAALPTARSGPCSRRGPRSLVA
eukprot:3941510-Rhodomonas_salina.2